MGRGDDPRQEEEEEEEGEDEEEEEEEEASGRVSDQVLQNKVTVLLHIWLSVVSKSFHSSSVHAACSSTRRCSDGQLECGLVRLLDLFLAGLHN